MTERQLITKEVDSIEKAIGRIEDQFFVDRIEHRAFNKVTIYTRNFIINLQLKNDVTEAAYNGPGVSARGALLPERGIS
jgi:hypothetical protein